MGLSLPLLRTIPWHSEHAIPIYASIASAGCLFINFLVSKNLLPGVKSRPASEVTESAGHVAAHGGRAIYGAKVLTLIGNLELLRVSLLRAITLCKWQDLELVFSFITFDPVPPNPEETASLFSLALFSFMDPTVWKAFKAPRTSLSDLPSLAGSDRSEYLIRAAFPHLDPLAKGNVNENGVRVASTPRCHMFLAIVTIFRKEIAFIAFLLLCNVTSTLSNPYGLKCLLEYLETKGQGATVKPWVWIVSLCIAPFTSTLIGQQYQRVLARGTVHLEAILTQLILQHALRIRIIAGGESGPITTESGVTVQQSPSSAAGEATKNLVGRMNNLISSDLQAIARGSEFMQVFFFTPLTVLLCVGFLYTILGWSALVGFTVMVLMMPMSGKVTKMLSGTAKEVSTKGDERVEVVTETITIIRMIKMFGWEKKMVERIHEKRMTELHWVWLNKTELLDEFTTNQEDSLPEDRFDEIGFRAASFSWSKEFGMSTPAKHSFKLNIEDELLFHRSGLNLIIGPTG
ncbi:hypothetical protein C0993_009322 [Termitomyces sp. T159_Od127]|nr:hypothetical protein C0993_009322 [Termitomyces sp. T159_Od127]